MFRCTTEGPCDPKLTLPGDCHSHSEEQTSGRYGAGVVGGTSST